MSDAREATSAVTSDAGHGPLRHFRVGRRAVLQSLATGAGVAAFAATASAAAGHAHHAAVTAVAPPPAVTAGNSLVFLDQHTFDTLNLLSDQIVPGARAARVAEVVDRLLDVEATDTQKRFMQSIGVFEREARESQGKPWKALTAEQANELLTTLSTLPWEDTRRQSFEGLKVALAEIYYSTEPGMKELGWQGTVAFAQSTVC